MNYYLIAGEASGDLHGANLMASIMKRDPSASFYFVGGDRMKAVSGIEPLIHSANMAFMGFMEVAANIRSVVKNLRIVKADLAKKRPDALVLIDFPGFNLKVAAYAKKLGIKVFYYISPKVWAWNQKRVNRIRQVVDHLFCILPFEVDFYKAWGMNVDYVGNPLLDAIAAYNVDPDFKIHHQLNEKPMIALLPGSRRMEIKRVFPEMLKLVRLFPGHQFVVAGAPNFNRTYYHAFMDDLRIPIIFDAAYDILKLADAAVVTSGTATLETALLNVPQVVVYKASPISIAIARMVINVDYISLVNLIMDKEVVKELIQKDANHDEIAEELNLLLNKRDYRSGMLESYAALHKLMGKPGASDKVADLMMQYLNQ